MKKIIKVLFFEILVKNANFYKFCCQAMNLWLGPCLAVYFIFLLFQAGRAYELCAYKKKRVCKLHVFSPNFSAENGLLQGCESGMSTFQIIRMVLLSLFPFSFCFFPCLWCFFLIFFGFTSCFCNNAKKKKRKKKKEKRCWKEWNEMACLSAICWSSRKLECKYVGAQICTYASILAGKWGCKYVGMQVCW